MPAAVAAEATLVARVLRRPEVEEDAPASAPDPPGDATLPMASTTEDVKEMHRWSVLSRGEVSGSGGTGDDPTEAESVATTTELMVRLGLLPEGGAATTVADRSTAVAAARRNNFAIMDPLLVPIAAACYPLGALLNHSCAPNCVVAYRLSRRGDGAPGEWIQEFRCTRPVAAGDELCHAYVDAAEPAPERASELSTRYGFACSCPRCDASVRFECSGPEGNESSVSSRSSPLSSAAETALSHARRLLDEAVAEEELSVERRKAERAVAILLAAEAAEGDALSGTEGTAAGPRSVPSPLLTWRLRGLEMAMNAAMLGGDWPAAAVHGTALTSGREAAYGTQYHPRVALDLVTLGGVLGELDNGGRKEAHQSTTDEASSPWERGRATLQRALEVLQVTAGSNAKLTVDVKNMLDDWESRQI